MLPPEVPGSVVPPTQPRSSGRLATTCTGMVRCRPSPPHPPHYTLPPCSLRKGSPPSPEMPLFLSLPTLPAHCDMDRRPLATSDSQQSDRVPAATPTHLSLRGCSGRPPQTPATSRAPGPAGRRASLGPGPGAPGKEHAGELTHAKPRLLVDIHRLGARKLGPL